MVASRAINKAVLMRRLSRSDHSSASSPSIASTSLALACRRRLLAQAAENLAFATATFGVMRQDCDKGCERERAKGSPLTPAGR